MLNFGTDNIMFNITYPCAGSSAILLGSSNPFQSRARLLEPSRRDTSILCAIVSVQYILCATQSTAIPSGERTPSSITRCVSEPLIKARNIACAFTSDQYMRKLAMSKSSELHQYIHTYNIFTKSVRF